MLENTMPNGAVRTVPKKVNQESRERRLAMKAWSNTITKFWWFIQGIILSVFGFLAWIPLSVTGIIVIICDCFYDSGSSTVRMSSRIMLMIYALVYMIYGGMLIAVASPDTWFAISMIIVGVINMALSIKLLISALSNKQIA